MQAYENPGIVKDVKIVAWNVEGLKYLASVGLSKYVAQFDVILFAETFQLSDWTISTHKCFHSFARKNEKGRPVGGLCVGMKPDFLPVELFQSPTCLVVSASSLNVISCYFQNYWKIEELIDSLLEALMKCDLSKNTVIYGDFNCRVDRKNEKSDDLINVMSDFGFKLTNDSALLTYEDPNGNGSTIDLIFTNFPVESVALDKESSFSFLRKHVPLICHSKLSNFQTSGNIRSPSLLRKVDLDLISYDKMHDVVLLFDNCDWENGYKSMVELILAAVPVKSERENSVVFDSECSKLRNTAHDLFKKLSESPHLRGKYNEAKAKFKSAVSSWKKELIEKNQENALLEAQTRPWILKPRRNESFTCPIHLENWSTHFTDLLNPEGIHVLPELEDWWLEYGNDDRLAELNRDVTYEELRMLVKEMKDKKAVGLDGLANEHIKISFDVLFELWVKLFNGLLHDGCIIDTWRTCIIKVLFKGKGELINPNNYRGISFLSHGFKLFTRLLSKRLYDFVEGYSLPTEQFGFRKCKSTEQAIRLLRDDVVGQLQKSKGYLYAVFVDMTKAFDMIPRNILIKKLAELHGIKGFVLSVIYNMYKTNYLKVFDGHLFSEDIAQNRGVYQGDSLSPLLFLLYVADLPDLLSNVKGLKSIMFADDLVFYADNIDTVKKGLILLESYCSSFLLKVNIAKTKVIKFRKGGKLSAHDVLYYNNEKLEFVNQYEYLGVLLQSSWTFTKHLRCKKLKMIKAMNMSKYLRELSLNNAERFFNIMLSPIVT